MREVGEDNFDFQDVDLDPIKDESDENENISEKSEEVVEDYEKSKEEEVFEVETILDRKLASNGELLYYVKWVSIIDITKQYLVLAFLRNPTLLVVC